MIGDLITQMEQLLKVICWIIFEVHIKATMINCVCKDTSFNQYIRICWNLPLATPTHIETTC